MPALRAAAGALADRLHRVNGLSSKQFHCVLLALAAGCYTSRYSVDTLPAEQLAGLQTG